MSECGPAWGPLLGYSHSCFGLHTCILSDIVLVQALAAVVPLIASIFWILLVPDKHVFVQATMQFISSSAGVSGAPPTGVAGYGYQDPAAAYAQPVASGPPPAAYYPPASAGYGYGYQYPYPQDYGYSYTGYQQ